MALLTVDGIYEDGKIELKQPVGVKKARVKVTFLPIAGAVGDEARETARQRAFARMRAGIDFGGEKFNREEIYEERMSELELLQNRSR